MGIWLSDAELTGRFGAGRTAMATGGDDSLIAVAISRAESRVMSELVALRYQPAELPSTPETTSETLKRLVGGFAWHYLHESKECRGEDVRAVYDDARSELKAVGSGHMSLLLSGDPAVDNARPQILMEPVVGAVDVPGYRRPTLGDCWEGFD